MVVVLAACTSPLVKSGRIRRRRIGCGVRAGRVGIHCSIGLGRGQARGLGFGLGVGCGRGASAEPTRHRRELRGERGRSQVLDESHAA